MDQTHQTNRRRAETSSKPVAALPPSRSCLTYMEVSALTRISVSTLRRRVKDGKLPFIQPGGHRTRIVFPEDVVERLLQFSGASEVDAAQSEKPASECSRQASPVPHGPRPKWLQSS